MLENLSSQELLILHLIVSLLSALLATQLFKIRYKGSIKTLFIFLLGFTLLLPILGCIVVLTFSILYAFVKKKSFLTQVKHFNKKEFYNNPYPQVKRIFGEGAIVDLASNQMNHSPNKMKGLVFMAENPSKKNFSLIKGLLSDPDNEIRLYSFSLLNTLETELNDKITKTLSRYEKENNPEQKAILATELASLYWEFIHYGLSDAESTKFILSKVETYAKLALAVKKEFTTYTILAKVAFSKNNYKKAEKLFKKALTMGASHTVVAPYLAEVAYKQGDYYEVKQQLSQISPLELTSMTAPLYRQWVKAS